MCIGHVLGGLILSLFIGSSHAAQIAPQFVYGTFLDGRDKDCASGIAVDKSGAAYVVAHTPSPDFPVTPGAFSTTTSVNNNDWVGFVSKISATGDRLLYSSFVGGNFRSSAKAVAVDSRGVLMLWDTPAHPRFRSRSPL
jgi:hypothetical protein